MEQLLFKFYEDMLTEQEKCHHDWILYDLLGTEFWICQKCGKDEIYNRKYDKYTR